MHAFIVTITIKGTNDALESYRERLIACDLSKVCDTVGAALERLGSIVLEVNIKESPIQPFGYETKVKP